MRSNIQHSTFNIERPTLRGRRGFHGCWKLNVECWAFLLCGSSLFAQVLTNTLPPLAPAYPQMPPPFWEQHGAAILIGGIILLALTAVVLWMIFKPKPQPVLPPEVVARQALAQLRGRPEDGKVLSEVSQVLRRYVGNVFGFSGDKMTTSEFSTVVAADTEIGSRLAEALAILLRACDKDKFIANKEAPPLNAVQRAWQLVDQIETQRNESKALKLSSR